MFQKQINSTRQALSLTAGTSITLGDVWIRQPRQGDRNSRLGAAAQKVDDAVTPTVRFCVFATTRTLINSLRVSLQVREYFDPSSLIAPFSDTRDVTQDFLMNEGSITLRPGHACLANFKIVLTNRDPSSTTIALQVWAQTWSAFLPHAAPSEVQDASGYGMGGLLDQNVGQVLPHVIAKSDDTRAAVAIKLPDFADAEWDQTEFDDFADEYLDGPEPAPETLPRVPEPELPPTPTPVVMEDGHA